MIIQQTNFIPKLHINLESRIVVIKTIP